MSRLWIVAIVLLVSVHGAIGQHQPIDGFVIDYAKKHDFNGTVLIARGRNTVLQQSFGLADRPFAVPMTNTTKFKIASVTKAFTAVLVLQLCDEGKIDLHKTIRTYLPDYAGEGADRVTIENLLNHTSGIDNMDKVRSYEEAATKGVELYQLPHSSDEILAKYASGKLVHKPGKVFDYDNGDYIILGKVIERITGKSFDEELKDRILAPLEMNESGMTYQRQIIAGLAPTYYLRDSSSELINDLPQYPENWYAAGGIYSTATDLLKFTAALFDGTLLKPESLTRMLTPGLHDYGYGVWIYEYQAGDVKYHAMKRPGAIMGAQAMLFHTLNKDLTIILLANTNEANLDDFCYQLATKMMTP